MEKSTSVVGRRLAAGDSGDVEAFDALLHGDVVVHAPRGFSTLIVTGRLIHDFAGVSGAGGSFRMDQAVICHFRDGARSPKPGRSPTLARMMDQMRS
jgi:ketosteroid isomerase-like protein